MIFTPRPRVFRLALPCAGPHGGEVIGWLSDLFRLGWGALYWNTRKTRHRFRADRGHAPCQVASDSGRALQTGCEAVLHLHSPARFRAVCPLLTRRADGTWVCSAHAEDVRPFWTRAALLLGGTGLVAWLLAALLALGGLRAIGYEFTYRQIAWPPAWREFRAVQARLYFQKAKTARAEGRAGDALLALRQAYDYNPRDYAAGLLLARLSQAGSPALSDATYIRLLNEHPDQHEQTAQAWYRALLARGDFPSVLKLARAAFTEKQSSAWLHALLFAARQTGQPAALASLADSPAATPSQKRLLALADALPGRSAAERVAALSAAAREERDAFAFSWLLQSLLDEDRPNLVVALLDEPDSPLNDRDKTRLRLDALSRAGRDAEHAALLRQVLALPTNPAIMELLGAHLVACPDRATLRACAEKFARDPLPPTEENYPRLLAWFAACGSNGDLSLARSAMREMGVTVARDSRTLEVALEIFHAPPPLRLDSLLPLLQPLPLEVSYALFRRYAPPPSPPH